MDPNWPSDPASLRSRLPNAKPVPESSGTTPKRGSIGNVLARLGWWLFLALASFVMLVAYWLDGESLLGPDPDVPVEKARSLLVWATILFASSVLPLAWTGAPRPLRVFGALYAIPGVWILAVTWLG